MSLPKPAWKKLLTQALLDNAMPPVRHRFDRLLQTHRFVYRALQQSGIENRSPFSLWDIFRIQWQSRGQTSKIRRLSIERLEQLDSPSPYFSLRASGFGQLLLAALFVSSLLPQTASTYRAEQPRQTILKIAELGFGDLDQDRMVLPTVSDYQQAAFEPSRQRPADSMKSLSGRDWIKRQPDQGYTLQLLSVSDPANLRQFCQQYKICNRSAIYTTTTKGQPITRLLLGSFRNHRQARQALENLPSGLSGWARSFQQVKEQL